MIPLQAGRHEYDVVVEQKRLNFVGDFNPDADEMIVFLHGLACSRESFRHVFDFPYFSHMSLLLFDLIGFGTSSKPEQFSYTMEEHAYLCEQVLTQLPPCKLHIVVHSMGGAVGLLFSPRLFDRVQSFANLEGNLISEDCGLLSRGIASVQFEEYRSQGFEEHKQQFADNPVLRFDQSTPQAVYYSAQSLVKWSDSGELLKRFIQLSCKACYLFGEENHSMSVLQKLDTIPTSMIHGSGHNMMVENPTEFYAKLAEFIEG